MNYLKQIYIVRHGETDYNKKRIVQGSGIDADLNEEGIRQAQAFYEAYQHIHFDKIYISTLKRTYQSVRTFIEEKQIPYQALEALNEISWGIKEGMPFEPEEHQYYLEMIQAWQNGETTRSIEGGESPQDVALRQREIIKILKSISENEEQTTENILICMHGRAMRILLTQLLNYPLSEMDIFEHRNLTLYQLTYNGSFFQVNTFNDITHLSNLEN